MRITAGTHRGRKLNVPEGLAVRPTTDKVRQAIFNILKTYDMPVDAVVLDGFAGSGALGLEALSRGAAQAVFIEKDPAHMKFIKNNAAGMKIENACRFILKAVAQTGIRPKNFLPAQLVFLDPPYRMNLLMPALQALAQGGWMAPDAVIVCEHENHAVLPAGCGFTLLDQRRYGDTQISFLRYQPIMP